MIKCTVQFKEKLQYQINPDIVLDLNLIHKMSKKILNFRQLLKINIKKIIEITNKQIISIDN